MLNPILLRQLWCFHYWKYSFLDFFQFSSLALFQKCLELRGRTNIIYHKQCIIKYFCFSLSVFQFTSQKQDGGAPLSLGIQKQLLILLPQSLLANFAYPWPQIRIMNISFNIGTAVVQTQAKIFIIQKNF